MLIIQRLVDTIDRPHTGIDIGQFSDPLFACPGLENSTQYIYSLLALTWTYWLVKRQQFKVSDTRAEGVPEFIFERGKCNILAILRFINVVAGKPPVKRRLPRLWRYTCIQISGGNEGQE